MIFDLNCPYCVAHAPKAYCKACNEVGMSNCGHFDECGGPRCITCHRPFAAHTPAAPKEPTDD